jgi:hypothetical protein
LALAIAQLRRQTESLGQVARSMTAQKGRTNDRTATSGETSEKALASGAVWFLSTMGALSIVRPETVIPLASMKSAMQVADQTIAL